MMVGGIAETKFGDEKGVCGAIAMYIYTSRRKHHR